MLCYDHQCNASNVLTLLVRNLLLQGIYPWIRDAYLSQVKNGDHLELYAYDSLLIRYNATEANANNNANPENSRGDGAGQPLHRDMGYVSENIMLNSQEEFIGGGTFFEDQLFPLLSPDNQHNTIMQTIQPLKTSLEGQDMRSHTFRTEDMPELQHTLVFETYWSYSWQPRRKQTLPPTQASREHLAGSTMQGLKQMLELSIQNAPATRKNCTSHGTLSACD